MVAGTAARPPIPRTVWALGLVSLFMDASSELVHSLLPLFLVGTLGASTTLVGLIEGVGEATAAITKVFSGWISDRIGRRKRLAVIGYGLAALTKPAFPLAASVGAVLAARFFDRVGKGIRGAPRDALVADVTPPQVRGAAFGLRQALDTVGAVVGPLLAILLMAALSDRIRLVLWWAVVPAAVAVAILVFGVKEPRAPAAAAARTRLQFGRAELARLGRPFWTVTAVGMVFSLARFSEAFLVLRARDDGFSLTLTPVVMIVMSLVYAISSAPAGALSDRMDRRLVLGAGLAVLIAADLVLALWPTRTGALAGAGLWGLHMGLTQGLFAALVADTAPDEARGTAFGAFNLATGLTILGASLLAGELWARSGPAATFLAGAAISALALAGVFAAVRGGPKQDARG
jgi:MFS family permease